MISHCVKVLVFFGLSCISLSSLATVPAWKIKPSESSLTFTATQNGAPVTGQFKTFSGDIHFDPKQLGDSNVNITVDMGSVSDVHNKLTETLKSSDWFDVKAFPQAVFKSSQFTKTGDKDYEAKGTLTIRDKTVPVTLKLTLEEYSDKQAKMKGSTQVKRTAFGVGQGEWKDTQAIKDDVQVDFVVTTVKKMTPCGKFSYTTADGGKKIW